ncbi:MAG TPA: tetratricopeptide repeat protein [Bryobacteraceae bacterium]|nr:tetratricopeptide repeat protein [Bryobacteraceae bacterium]
MGALVSLGVAPLAHAQSADSRVCAGCHRQIWETYSRTGMARSFSRPSPERMLEDLKGKSTYYHRASDSYFSMLQRDGEYFQRRYQLDSAGRQINVMEKRIDYIMGSGNHARAYLNRTAANTLMELPLGWYAEKGGYWAMNPGYDRPDHDGFRRPISYDCMFCHNGYPKIPAANEQSFARPVYEGELPQGIDCQRCHGPGARHAQLAGTPGAKKEDIRNAIVNPARLTPERQMDVCMVCHLESTSFPLPNAIQRYERGPFSYRPGEPLGQFILNFDHAPGMGRDDKFELVNAAYRLRRSQCFLKSNGKLLCTTCHNPHDVPRGVEAERHFTAVCRQCHASVIDQQIASGKHPRDTNCVSCHMPKRRTEDVVHVVATDHYIQRRKPAGDLTADIPERHQTGANAYRGPVVLYYPQTLAATPENDLLIAIAQVKQGSNLTQGIAQLTAAIQKYRPQRAEYYLELAEALEKNGQLAKAILIYREAVQKNPKLGAGIERLGTALRHAGNNAQAAGLLKQAISALPDDPLPWHELGLTYRALGRSTDAVAALTKAIALDPDLPEAHNNLGILWLAGGEGARAETAFREAIRIRPDYADAHGNLANLLREADNFAGAQNQFEIALRLRPEDAATRYNYAMLLGRTGRYDEAQRELEAALRYDAGFADAHQLLGELLMAKGQTQDAITHYSAALRINPDSSRAHLGLGTALAALGDISAAIPHLEKAAASADAAMRERAAAMLQQLKKQQ